MTKNVSPLLGYNNNVRHKNRVFHIQTEDSGIKHPHIITHVFMDGGRILKSVKTSYAEHIGQDKLGDVVRQMMKEQHKAMFRALRDGELDSIVDGAIAASAAKSASRPPPPPPSSEELPPVTTRDADDPPPLTLDLDAVAGDQPTFRPQGDLPPPPPNVLARSGDPGTGRYRTLEEREERAPVSKPPRPERIAREEPGRKSERPPRSERPPPASARKSERPAAKKSDRPQHLRKRPDPRAEPPSEPKQPVASQSSRPRAPTPRAAPAAAAARPAAIFGQARPQQSSIFGEDIISDKSLDEVILSYLAEDLEEGSK